MTGLVDVDDACWWTSSNVDEWRWMMVTGDGDRSDKDGRR